MNEQQAQMDKAAEEAAKEKPTDNASVTELRAWWKKWKNTAGHNRLAKVMAFAG